MAFGIEPYLERARKHIESNDEFQLRYACLELRLGLERIAYQKLQLRLGLISPEQLRGWQPRKVIETLIDLVDEHLAEDVTARISLNDGNGSSSEKAALVCKMKGFSPKKLGKYWQKISSHLHVPMPEKKGDLPPKIDTHALATFLTKVIQFIEEISIEASDFFVAERVEFTCDECKEQIFRNALNLNDNDIVECRNPQCHASYLIKLEPGKFGYRRNFQYLPCQNDACSGHMSIDENIIKHLGYKESLFRECSECNTQYKISWGLYWETGPEDEQCI